MGIMRTLTPSAEDPLLRSQSDGTIGRMDIVERSEVISLGADLAPGPFLSGLYLPSSFLLSPPSWPLDEQLLSAVTLLSHHRPKTEHGLNPLKP